MKKETISRDRSVIGIVTLQNSNNYGAMYQVYAMSKYLENLGHEVFVLDYEMTRDNSSYVDYLKHPVTVIQKMYYREMFSFSYYKKLKQVDIGKKKEGEFKAVFDDFRIKYLKITKERYNYQKLKVGFPKADAYICGSDQIWAADFFFTSPAFLLGFVPDHIKRIAYAPSFGKDQLEPYLRRVFRLYLRKFDAISVREKSGVDIIDSVVGLRATQVLDPTLLLNKENYMNILDYSLVPSEPYIFVYRLGQEESLSNWMTKAIDEISLIKKLPIHVVSTNSHYPFGEAWNELTPTPGQLLGLIEKSSLMVTNSFHGTVFSIILKAHFLSFARDKFKDKQNTRMNDLLSQLGISDLFCSPFSDTDEVFERLNYSYCYDHVFDNLEKLKEVSGNYLKTALD